MALEYEFGVTINGETITIVNACCDTAAKIKGIDYLKSHGLNINCEVKRLDDPR